MGSVVQELAPLVGEELAVAVHFEQLSAGRANLLQVNVSMILGAGFSKQVVKESQVVGQDGKKFG